MPNGAPGDHPVTDIFNHGLRVFDPEVDLLIAQIVMLGGESQLGGIIWLQTMDDASRSELERIRDGLVAAGRASGWEVDALLEEAEVAVADPERFRAEYPNWRQRVRHRL